MAVACGVMGGSALWAQESKGREFPHPDLPQQAVEILSQRCWHCHGPDVQEGGLRLDSSSKALVAGDSGEPAIVPGDPAASHLLEWVQGDPPAMPAEESPLTAEQVSILKEWIAAGAPWPEPSAFGNGQTMLWSLQPLQVSAESAGRDSARVIDEWVQRELSRQGLTPSPPADSRTLLRRMYLDVWGLPPPPEEIDRASRLADWEPLVEELLASPRYAERWARHWLDVVRFAESHGFETNVERPTAFHYRDWVIEAFHQDMPYNQFLAAQIAGDLLGHDRATGFLVAGTTDQVKSPDPILTLTQRQDELADMVNTTGTAMWGLTLGCARCHAHKFDPISQRDFFALAAVFSGVQHGDRQVAAPGIEALRAEHQRLMGLRSEQRGIVLNQQIVAQPGSGLAQRPAINSRENLDRFLPHPARWIRFQVCETNLYEPCLDEFEVWGRRAPEDALTNLALASRGAALSSSGDYPDRSRHKLELANDGQVGNESSWISSENGKGWLQIELPEEAEIVGVVWGRDRTGEFQDRTPSKYRIETAVKLGVWTLAADDSDRVSPGEPLPVAAPNPASESLQLERLDAELERLTQAIRLASTAYAGTFETDPPPLHRLRRGEVTAPQEVVDPDLPAILGQLNLSSSAGDSDRRRRLAHWLKESNHPLIARVIVNRIWQHHFGRGLVATPSDFGHKGMAPSHPELLDWLAHRLIASGWSLKHLHRLILNSDAYRQANRFDSQAASRDADNRWLWRFQPRRLEAEAIRDSMLFVSGELDLRMGGPGFSAFEPNDNYVRVYEPKQQFGPADFRRMVYMMRIRMEQDATFGAFDSPDGALVCPVRSRSVTPLQALNLLNSPFVLGRSEKLADRVTRECLGDLSARIPYVFRLVYGRPPTVDEGQAAAELVSQYGLTALCRALLNSNEFLILP